MRALFSIRTRETTYRIIIVVLALVTLVISGISMTYAYSAIEQSKKNIYVLNNSTSLVKASSTDINNSYDILFKGQIEEVNKLIYQQVPDPENVNHQTAKALMMSDQSVSKMIDALKQKDYYSSIINQNYFTLLMTDSIQMNYSTSPYEFKYYGKLRISRNANSFYRTIITTGTIEDTKQPTKNNERGFLIRNMRIDTDKEISQ